MLSADEFDAWLTQHATVFPDVGAYFGRERIDKRALRDQWYEVLKFQEFADLKQVTSAMLAGRIPEVDKFKIHQTPARVRAAAQKIAGDRMASRREVFTEDGERAVTCMRCADSGYVTVWAAVTMRGILEGKVTLLRPGGWYTGAVCCDCEYGRYCESQLQTRGAGIAGFNARCMLPVPPEGDTDRGARAALIDWVLATFPDLQRVRE